DRRALPQHRNSEDGAKASQLLGLRPSVVRVSEHIGNVSDLTLEQCSSKSRPSFRLNGHIPDVIHELGREAVTLCAKELASNLPTYGGLAGVTQSCSRFNQRLKHRPEIERRAAHDLQDIGSRGLLLQ